MKKLIIFGASGDLTKRMLMPSLSRIDTKDIQIIAYARSPLQNTYQYELRKFYDYNSSFPEQVKYIQGSYNDLSPLKQVIDENTYHYFAVPPEIYFDLLTEISKLKFKAVGIEKPFGVNYESFVNLTCFKKNDVFFIDHYLLKPLLVVTPLIFQKMPKLCSFLDKNNVIMVESCFNESILAKGRAYFDKTGIVKDVMQNHLMVILGSILSSCENFEVCEESRKREFIFNQMTLDQTDCIFGQYEGYSEEVRSFSKTETFAMALLQLNSNKWKNVPFVISAGKGLKEKSTEVSFLIRRESNDRLIRILFENSFETMSGLCGTEELRLCFNFSPGGEIYIRSFKDNKESKYIIFDQDFISKQMDTHYNNLRGHEIVFNHLINNKPFNHAGFGEVSKLWKLFDGILKMKKNNFFYKVGVSEPSEATCFRDRILFKKKSEEI